MKKIKEITQFETKMNIIFDEYDNLEILILEKNENEITIEYKNLYLDDDYEKLSLSYDEFLELILFGFIENKEN